MRTIERLQNTGCGHGRCVAITPVPLTEEHYPDAKHCTAAGLYAPLTAAGLDYFVYSSTLAIYGRHGLFPLSGGATVREIAVSNILHISIAFCAERQIFTGIVISLGTVPFDHKATLV